MAGKDCLQYCFNSFVNSKLSILKIVGSNPYNNLLKTIAINGKEYKYFDLGALGDKYCEWMVIFSAKV